MLKNADEKRIKILEIAKRRFSHYGMAKTTMAEIAKDLSFSKALLYYYFPDKNSLFIAVLEYVVEEFNEEVNQSIEKINKIDEALFELIRKRIEFVRRYYYIIEYTLVSKKETPTELEKVFMQTFELHRQSVKDLFQKGIDKGELKPMDTDENSKIFLSAAMGMRLMVMKDMKDNFIPNPEDFETILEMQLKLSRIFIDGLRVQS